MGKRLLFFAVVFAVIGMVLKLSPIGDSSEPHPRMTVLTTPPPAVASSSPPGQGTTSPTAEFVPAKHDVPELLLIPSIRVKVSVVSKGLNSDGELDPPPGFVQWYKATPKPGQPGAAILAGHVRYNTPDVFWNLNQIRKGAVITVRYASGHKVEFVVTDYQPISKLEATKSKRLWNLDGKITSSEVRLITCDKSGNAANQGFPNNFVVYAKRK
jgi:sortase (surface protein transpeptidase)